MPPGQALTLTVNVSGGSGNPTPTGSVTVMTNNPAPMIYDSFQYADGTLINGLTAQSGNSAWLTQSTGIGEVEGFHLLDAAASGESGDLYAGLSNTSTLNGTPQAITTIGGTFRLCPPASGTNDSTASFGIVAAHDSSLSSFLQIGFGPTSWFVHKQLNGVVTTIESGAENLSVDCATEYTVEMIVNQAAGTLQVIPPDGFPAPAVVDPDVTTIDAQFGIWEAANIAPNESFGEWGSAWMGGGYVSESTPLSGGNASIEIPAGSLALGVQTLTVTYTPDANSASLYTSANGSSKVTVENEASGSVVPTVTVGASPANVNLGQGETVTVDVVGGNGAPTPTGTAILSASVPGSSSSPVTYDTFQYADGTPIDGLIAQTGNSVWVNLGSGIGDVESDHLLNASPSGEAGVMYATLPNTSTLNGAPQAITTLGCTIRMCPSAAGTYDPTYTSVGLIAAHDLSLNSLLEIGFGPTTWWFNKVVNGVVTGLQSGTENLPVDCATEYTVQMIIDQAAGTVEVIPPDGVPAPVIADPDVTTIDAQYGIWEPENNAPYKYIGEFGSVWMGGGYVAPAAALSGGKATFNIPPGSLLAGDVTLTASFIPDSQSWATYRTATGTGAISVSHVTPSVNIALSETSITTSQPEDVTVTVSGGSGQPTPTGSVTLTATGFNSQATALQSGSVTITIPAGSLASGTDTLTASYTPDSASSQFYGGATQTAVITVTPPDFTLTASPASLSVKPGGNASSTISVTDSGGFSGQVALSASGLPTGVTASFAAGSASGTQVVTFAVAASASATTTPTVVTIRGTSGSISSATQVALTITTLPAFTLAVSPASLSVVQGGKGSSTVTINGTGGFTGQVSLSASGLPSGAVASFAAGSAAGTQVVTFTVAASAPVTTAPAVVTITGTSGGLSATTQIAFTVTAAPSFTLAASPSSLSLAQGGNGSSTISITGSGGFAGQVSLTASGLPSGVTASFASGSASGTQVVTFTAATSAPVTATPAAVTIQGTSGTLSARSQITLSITAAPGFTGSGNGTNSLSVTAGATTGNTLNIGVVGTNGFSGSVNLSCAVATMMSNATDLPQCSLSPATLTIIGSAAQNSTLRVTTTAPSSAANATGRPAWLPASGTVLALLLVLIRPSVRRKWPLLLALVAFGGSMVTAGCGSSHATSGGGGSGTTPGSYTIKVSGISGSQSATVATINLTVQ